ncbi:hypothetical protein B0293_37715 [Amycolatopsis azurea DSM 43854]|uniref:Uncharacterized protein n=1 Tax=Amycolatopsis azurea DSM 43854 TaxID=1238180 RepID=M2QH97_9PSEU|nr:hypothetical protein C791_3634 [Amycolatopsis azurea DSM 43854]OOC01339.1 hypothetical protein B0293_37715 [Amycolatopsis azurea DSM 43854]
MRQLSTVARLTPRPARLCTGPDPTYSSGLTAPQGRVIPVRRRFPCSDAGIAVIGSATRRSHRRSVRAFPQTTAPG